MRRRREGLRPGRTANPHGLPRNPGRIDHRATGSVQRGAEQPCPQSTGAGGTIAGNSIRPQRSFHVVDNNGADRSGGDGLMALSLGLAPGSERVERRRGDPAAFEGGVSDATVPDAVEEILDACHDVVQFAGRGTTRKLDASLEVRLLPAGRDGDARDTSQRLGSRAMSPEPIGPEPPIAVVRFLGRSGCTNQDLFLSVPVEAVIVDRESIPPSAGKLAIEEWAVAGVYVLLGPATDSGSKDKGSSGHEHRRSVSAETASDADRLVHRGGRFAICGRVGTPRKPATSRAAFTTFAGAVTESSTSSAATMTRPSKTTNRSCSSGCTFRGSSLLCVSPACQSKRLGHERGHILVYPGFGRAPGWCHESSSRTMVSPAPCSWAI